MQNPVEILNQEFNKRRTRNPNFSLRSFAKWLKISPAQLSQMMTGKRPVTLNSVKKISERLELSPIEKKALINSLLKDKDFIQPNTDKKLVHMQEDQFRVISDWYHFAILSLTKLKEAKADPRWIARRLGINVEQAHQAMLRLERMGIIQTKPDFKQICEPIEVVSTVPSDAIRKYHKQNLGLATEKIDTIPLHLREYQSISIPLNPKHVKLFKKHIDDFLEQASELSDKQNGMEIYNLNVQLFPVTTIKEVEG
jgi:uncharacterized protein (TIGR02147 family)